MAHKRNEHFTVSGEWARHLRPYLRRAFWKGERQAAKQHELSELRVMSAEDTDDTAVGAIEATLQTEPATRGSRKTK